MPPASLSTFAVIKPGPTTARINRIRVFERFRNFMGNLRRHMDGADHRRIGRHRINAVRESDQRKSTIGKNFWDGGAGPGNPYIFARSILITSSEVITPFNLLFPSMTGSV